MTRTVPSASVFDEMVVAQIAPEVSAEESVASREEAVVVRG